MTFKDDLDRERAHILRLVRQAGSDWAEAMRAHKLAPPDAGFGARLRQLSEAAAREQVAWEHAHAAGLMWRPIPGAEAAEPPYELRPGTGRRGPDELWRLLCAGGDAIGEVPSSRFDVDAVYDARRGTPGKLVTRWGDRIRSWDCDLVVSVPLHWRRRTARGFNQAEALARSLARGRPPTNISSISTEPESGSSSCSMSSLRISVNIRHAVL